MKKITIFLLFIGMLSMISCQHDHFSDKTTKNDNRLKIKSTNINLVDHTGLKSIQRNPSFIFTLVAEVDAPTLNNKVLQATHVDIMGSVAYVSYNMKGPETIGALDIIDISNPNIPSLISTIFFDDMDINTVKHINGKIFIGGQDIHGGFVAIVTLDTKTELNIFRYGSPGAHSTVSLDDIDGMVLSASGSNSGITVFNPDTGAIESFVEIIDARSAKSNPDGNIYALGKHGLYLINNNNVNNIFPLNGNVIQNESKADLDVSSEYIFAAMNHGGTKIFNNNELVQEIPKPMMPAGADPEDFVTNSVSFNDPLLFIANGGAGINVCGKTDHFKTNLPFSEMGYFDFGGPLSSNFVVSRGNHIFIATGLGGLKILTFEATGVPDDIVPGEPCETLKAGIIDMFPETQNATVLHPYLFDGQHELRVITQTETEVWVQFIWEGAGWKNTFGYYTYELGNEPTSTSQLNKTVLFPNVSGVNEGGGLQPGDMIFVGEFPANTVIGFYLVAQGWQGGEMVGGLYTHYTDLNLNPNNNQQHLLFTESCCNELVLTFEDIRLPGGDKDYNDIILTIKDNNLGLENLAESFVLDGVYFADLCNTVDPNEPGDDCQWSSETAFGGSIQGGGGAWWFYFDNTINASQPIYAGQNLIGGAYVNVADGTLTINLGPNMILKNVNEAVKVQGYNANNLPTSRPPAGQFTTYKGNELIIQVPFYEYYVIHLDVLVCNLIKQF